MGQNVEFIKSVGASCPRGLLGVDDVERSNSASVRPLPSVSSILDSATICMACVPVIATKSLDTEVMDPLIYPHAHRSRTVLYLSIF
jgi:hypothetical protein